LKILRLPVRLALIVIATAFAPLPQAAEVQAFSVTRTADTYRIHFDARLHATVKDIYQQLTDYQHLNELSPNLSFISAGPAPEGKGVRVTTELRSCFLFFCRTVLQVEDVTVPDDHTIVSRVVEGKGDFASGESVWRLEPQGDDTLLHYEATRTPAFWVPPVIGSWIIEHGLRDELESSVIALERIPGP
jgi:hypothetical protein